jgi:outer membrane lipoprotein SlyB
MSGGSVSSSFPAGSYEFDTVDVNINGRIDCTYHYYGNCSIQYPSGNLLDIIESMVYKFVKMLPNIIDMSFDTIDFFGDVKAVDDNIKAFPIYFVLSGNRYGVYKIDSINITNISLVSVYDDFNDAIDCLYNIDNRLIENYYGQEDYDEEEYDDDEYVDDIEGDFDDDITGNMYGMINGDMNGDIIGNMYGVINGDIVGNMYGTINNDMNGDIVGNMHSTINGDMNGDIVGHMYSDIIGDMNGDILGSFEGTIYGCMYGSFLNGE